MSQQVCSVKVREEFPNECLLAFCSLMHIFSACTCVCPADLREGGSFVALFKVHAWVANWGLLLWNDTSRRRLPLLLTPFFLCLLRGSFNWDTLNLLPILGHRVGRYVTSNFYFVNIREVSCLRCIRSLSPLPLPYFLTLQLTGGGCQMPLSLWGVGGGGCLS